MQRTATLVRPRVSHHNDNHPVMEPEIRRARIARAAEEASPGPDMSEFAENYGLKTFA